jgi:hypothetical protein
LRPLSHVDSVSTVNARRAQPWIVRTSSRAGASSKKAIDQNDDQERKGDRRFGCAARRECQMSDRIGIHEPEHQNNADE